MFTFCLIQWEKNKHLVGTRGFLSNIVRFVNSGTTCLKLSDKWNHAHFWPHWLLESSKHAPAWQEVEFPWSLPALPVCVWLQAQRAGHGDVGTEGWMGPDGSLCQRARHQKGWHLDVRPWLDTPSFICNPPQKPVDCVEKWRGGGGGGVAASVSACSWLPVKELNTLNMGLFMGVLIWPLCGWSEALGWEFWDKIPPTV